MVTAGTAVLLVGLQVHAGGVAHRGGARATTFALIAFGRGRAFLSTAATVV